MPMSTRVPPESKIARLSVAGVRGIIAIAI
jgi:hypothetical protein